LCRTYSLTIDSVKSYTVTLCPNDTHYAQTVIASKHENQDLFWALRGGMASNFGVVSQIVYEIIEVPDIVQYSIVWPWGQATKILKKWQDTSITRPVNFNEDLILFHNPQTTHGIELSGIYVNIHNKSTRTIVSEIHEEVDMLGGILTIQPKTKYSNLYRNLVKNRIYYNYSIIQPMFVDRVSPKYIVKMLNESINLKSPVSITLTLLGGNICNKSASDTAFYPRNKRFFIDPAAFWNDITETSIMEGWIKNIVSYLIDIKEVVAYVGFPITFNDIKFDNSIYYGKNYDRLLEIKNMYDPLNILTSCGTL